MVLKPLQVAVGPGPRLTSAGCEPIILVMRACIVTKVVTLVLVMLGLVPLGSFADELQDANARSGRRVTLQVTDVPLSEVLNILAKSVPLELKGSIPSDERITAQFSNATLEEALNRIMRGYNYVLVQSEGSTKPLLVLMNRIERSAQKESAALVPAGGASFPPPVPVPSPMPGQDGRPRPGGPPQSQPGQGQPLPVITPPPMPVTAPPPPDAQPNAPVYGQPGGIAPFQGMPGGPGMAPPGMAADSSGPGSAPPGSFSPPVFIPPQQGSASGMPAPSSPPQVQQPPQQSSPEPARVMTPFGERPAE